MSFQFYDGNFSETVNENNSENSANCSLTTMLSEHHKRRRMDFRVQSGHTFQAVPTGVDQIYLKNEPNPYGLTSTEVRTLIM